MKAEEWLKRIQKDGAVEAVVCILDKDGRLDVSTHCHIGTMVVMVKQLGEMADASQKRQVLKN